MELTLNLIWLGVAVVAILAQMVMLFRAGATAWRRENQWPKIVAMACALVILFFVISMTDDLHDQALLIEERKLGRIALGAQSSADPGSERFLSHHSLLFFFVAPFSLPPLLALSKLGPQFDPQFAPAIESNSLCTRAPPAVPA
jgi:hypothetical protein